MLTNKDVARLLKETAALIELTGGNEFRARAFSSAARTIEGLDEPVSRLIASGELKDVRGIGSALAAQVAEIVERGTFDVYEDLLSAIPPGLTQVLRVKGLGGKKVRKLWQALGITSLEELEEAATIGRLADLAGFGAKSQQNILAAIKLLQQYGTQRHYAHAAVTADPYLVKIRESEGITQADYAGEMRRKLEIVSAVEVVAGASDAASAAGALAKWLEPADDRATFTGRLPDGLPLIVYLVGTSTFGTELWRRTGSEEHVKSFEERFGHPSEMADEKELYAAAGLSFIPPEMREHDGELDVADDRIPNLITDEDIRGSLHNHSTYSDGAHTLRQMVEAARSIGYTYYAACDHSQSLVIARGMTMDRVRNQQAEIRSINDEIAADGSDPFRVFSGIESDILYDGSLDYPAEVLATFDIVVASVHSRFGMTRNEATDRIIRAVENPYTTILGHPTGRLLLRREGYPIDHHRVIDACAANGVVIEINANPRRLDIDWRWVRRATEKGILIAIDPDAHSIDELYYMRWGVAVARKGWLEPEQCLNAKSLDAFTDWLEARRRQRAAVTQV